MLASLTRNLWISFTFFGWKAEQQQSSASMAIQYEEKGEMGIQEAYNPYRRSLY